MEYQLKVKPSVQKKLEKLPKADYYRILSALSILADNPYVGKKMKGDFRGSYTYRVWPYRIIYDIYRKQLFIIIIRVGHRQGVYK